MVVDADKGLVIGTQTVSSFVMAAQELVPKGLKQYTEPVLPKLAPGKVPTAIQLRFGKNDAGERGQGGGFGERGLFLEPRFGHWLGSLAHMIATALEPLGVTEWGKQGAWVTSVSLGAVCSIVKQDN